MLAKLKVASPPAVKRLFRAVSSSSHTLSIPEGVGPTLRHLLCLAWGCKSASHSKSAHTRKMASRL